MRISHKHKFVFIATGKTGSTTIGTCLDEYSDVKSTGTKRTEFLKDNRYYTHISAGELKPHFQEKGWDWGKYFSFAFVRNPWSRLVSNYFYRYHRRPNAWKEESFWDFIFSGAKHSLSANSQLSYMVDTSGNQLVDFIGKYENLQQDFDIVCDKIGIPKQQLPHINKTKHKHYTEYYDNETRDFVAEKYAKDIEYFGYEFGE